MGGPCGHPILIKEIQMAKRIKKEESVVDRMSEIFDITKTLNDKFGGNVAFTLDNGDAPTEIKHYISTGSTLLDIAISNRADGGLPCGRVVEISGTESSGKSLLAIHAVVDTQKKGGYAIYFDTENATSVEFMERLGVDTSKLIYVQPKTIEDLFEMAESILQTIRASERDCPVLIVWDSLAATPSAEEASADYDHREISSGARAISRGLKKIVNYLGQMSVCFIIINQVRQNINTFGYAAEKYTTPGGMAPKFYSSVRITISKGSKIENKISDSELEWIGVKANVIVKKNKIAPPYRKAEFDIYFRHGIDDISSWIPILEKTGVVSITSKDGTASKSGRYYTINLPDGPITITRGEYLGTVANNESIYNYLKQVVVEKLLVTYKQEDNLADIDSESIVISEVDSEKDFDLSD